jgi:AAA domain
MGKTWTLPDLAVAVATGELALSRFAVAEPGPVLLILEESGRAALHRRLDKLVRDGAIEPGRLDELYVTANRARPPRLGVEGAPARGGLLPRVAPDRVPARLSERASQSTSVSGPDCGSQIPAMTKVPANGHVPQHDGSLRGTEA